MKKLFTILIAVVSLFILGGCNKEKETILIPNGSPALALTYIDYDDYDVTYVSGSDVLTSSFISESYDYIVAPVQMGAKLYNLNKNYTLACVVVECNYYLVSKEEISLNNLSEKTIVLFGENTMPDIVTKYVFNKNSIEGLNITYVSSAQDSASSFIAGSYDVALLSEPQISSIEARLGSVYTIDLSEEFIKDESISFIPQAGLFVKNGTSEKNVNKIKEIVKNSIESVNSDKEAAAEYIQNITIDGYNKLSKGVITSAIPRAKLSYYDAKEKMNDINSFFEILNSYNSKLIGGEVSEKFYN